MVNSKIYCGYILKNYSKILNQINAIPLFSNKNNYMYLLSLTDEEILSKIKTIPYLIPIMKLKTGFLLYIIKKYKYFLKNNNNIIDFKYFYVIFINDFLPDELTIQS